MVVAGRDGLVRWASPAVRDLLHRDPDALVGQPIEVLVPEEYLSRHRKGWASVWRRGRMPPPGGPVMIPVVCGDGEVRRFASHLQPLFAPHGQLLAVAAVWVSPSEADADVRELT
jgi:hypothetical protein